MPREETLGILAVLEGITKGVNSGLEKRREFDLQEKKIKADEAQQELLLQRQTNEANRLDLLERKAFGEQEIKKEELGLEKERVGAKVRSETDEALNRLSDNKRSLMDAQSKLLPFITRTEMQLEGLDPETDAELYVPLKAKLDKYNSQFNRYEDEIKSADDAIYSKSNKRLGVPKPSGKLKPQGRAAGGATIGTLKPAEAAHVNEIKRLGSDPNATEEDIRRMAGGLIVDSLSQEGQEELRQALKQAIINKRR